MNTVNLSGLKPAGGSHHRRKILGRGEGSGHGQTSTRGMKGQRSRSGSTRRMGFEGGQTPLLRRIPKRGFNNAYFKKSYTVVNLSVLENLFSNGDTVSPDNLVRLGVVKDKNLPVKILGQGELTKSLTIKAHAASVQAANAVKKAGGTLEIIR